MPTRSAGAVIRSPVAPNCPRSFGPKGRGTISSQGRCAPDASPLSMRGSSVTDDSSTDATACTSSRIHSATRCLNVARSRISVLTSSCMEMSTTQTKMCGCKEPRP